MKSQWPLLLSLILCLLLEALLLLVRVNNLATDRFRVAQEDGHIIVVTLPVETCTGDEIETCRIKSVVLSRITR